MTPQEYCNIYGACDGGRSFAIKFPTMKEVWDNCTNSPWLCWMLRREGKLFDPKYLEMAEHVYRLEFGNDDVHLGLKGKCYDNLKGDAKGHLIACRRNFGLMHAMDCVLYSLQWTYRDNENQFHLQQQKAAEILKQFVTNPYESTTDN